MADELGDPPSAAHWLAWATAVLLIIGLVSAVALNIGNSRSDDGVVAVAGRAPVVDVPTTTTLSPAVSTTAPPPTVARTTTVPKAAAAVLKAIASTAPPTTQPPPATTTTSTTSPPPTTTTTTPTTSTTSTSTTSTTIPPKAVVNIVNQHPSAVVVTVNGQVFTVAVGQTVDRDVTAAADNKDVFEVHTAADTACAAGATYDLQAGGRYRLTVSAGATTCTGGNAVPVLTLVTLP